MSQTHSKNLAVFGGSFDPIHNGHYAIIKKLVSDKRFQKVIIVPNHLSPFKKESLFTAQERITFLQACCETWIKTGALEISTLEIEQPSFSVDTIRAIKQQYPDFTLYFILGIDSFLEIHRWKSAPEVLQNCNFLVLNREGFVGGEERLQSYLSDLVQQKLLQSRNTIEFQDWSLPHISSTSLREKIRTHEDFTAAVPAQALALLKGHL